MVIVALSLVYAVLQIAYVRPFLWPAGTGAMISNDPSSALPLIARPPNVAGDVGRPARVVRVAAPSPAATAGIQPGDVLLVEERAGVGRTDLSGFTTATPSQRLD